jgi:4-alpha-glucanotransferase
LNDIERAGRWGVATGYRDASGAWRDVPGTTVGSVLEAMGADGEAPASDDHVWCIGVGEPRRLDAPARLLTEDGAELDVVDALPPDLPVGYHQLVGRDGSHVTRLIVSPRACFLPDRLRTWGWALQLYALRTRESWGIGDLDDLRRLARWSRGLGAGMVLVSPLHAPSPGVPQQPSPYYPSSRRFRNLLHLRVSDERLNDTARAMNANRHIDRDAILRLKLQALEAEWDRFTGDAAFDHYVKEQADSLMGYATFCARRERGHADPDRVRFHMWVQWLLDRQLEIASRELDLVHDLAVGVDPDGADAWVDRHVYANGVSVGAPPDEFNTRGQDWGLLPFDPWRLRAHGYQPFIETVRAGFRHAGGLRVDHVMGLFRLFWVPAGCGPDEGTYVHYPAGDLLDILAVESHRARAFVVGEDLGTVEDEVRADLARRRVLSYRLLYFEPGDPSALPENALAAVTTHDLPTIAGLWTGRDLTRQRDAGMRPNAEGATHLRARIRSLAGVEDDAPVDEVVAGTHRALARAPSALLAATLDDALSVEERPNLPGTTEATNWSIALPLALDAIEHDSRVRGVAEALRRRPPPEPAQTSPSAE